MGDKLYIVCRRDLQHVYLPQRVSEEAWRSPVVRGPEWGDSLQMGRKIVHCLVAEIQNRLMEGNISESAEVARWRVRAVR